MLTKEKTVARTIPKLLPDWISHHVSQDVFTHLGVVVTVLSVCPAFWESRDVSVGGPLVLGGGGGRRRGCRGPRVMQRRGGVEAHLVSDLGRPNLDY